MKSLCFTLIGCLIAAACGSDDKALRSPGPGSVTVTTVGAAGSSPVNPVPPPVAVGPTVPQGAGIGGTKVTLPDPFGASGSSTLGGAAGAPALGTPSSGAAGGGF